MSTKTDVRGPKKVWIWVGVVALTVQVSLSVGCPGGNPGGDDSEVRKVNPELPTEGPRSVTIEIPNDALPEALRKKDDTPPAADPDSSAPTENTNDQGEPEFSGPMSTGESDPPQASSPVIDPDSDASQLATEQFVGWEKPQLALFISGRQHGYIEPCGCTGLANQKGGLLRRHTCLNQLRDKGWDVVPLDLGNQVRRFGAQASIKFTRTAEALAKVMGYQAIGLGPDDLKLPSTDLIQAIVNSADEHVFTSANVELLGDFVPKSRVIEASGHKLGVTSVLGAKSAATVRNDDAELLEAVPSLKSALQEMESAGCELRVLLAYATIEETKELIAACPEFDLVVTAGGDGEPTLQPEMVKVGDKEIPMVQVGSKGMYVGVVGWFPGDEMPLKYQRVPLDAQFEDSEEIKTVFKQYQDQLTTLGLSGLEVSPVSHPSGSTFVGSDACGDCHTTAFDIWKNGLDGMGGPHFHATQSLVEPGERTWVKRHHDPECLSCHVTGWNPQRYFPYEGGYLELEASAALHGNGCENCHGPGSRHVAAENGDIDVTADELQELKDAMKVKLEATMCMECHDLDNSPDFHVDGAFEKYWARIVHEGKD